MRLRLFPRFESGVGFVCFYFGPRGRFRRLSGEGVQGIGRMVKYYGWEAMTNEALIHEGKLGLAMTWQGEKLMTWHWEAGKWAVRAARLGWVSAA